MIYEVGRTYRLLCVRAVTRSARIWVPVVGPPHDDRELGIHVQHYHPNWQFVSDRAASRLFPYSAHDRQRYVEHGLPPRIGLFKWVIGNWDGQPEFRRKRCVFPYQAFPILGDLSERLEALCANLRLNPRTLVCPHRGVCLAGLPVDSDGTVVCPGHGARWNVVTGELVPRSGEVLVPMRPGAADRRRKQ